MLYQTINPFDGKLIKSFDAMSDNDIQEKTKMAQICFETWRHLPFHERAKIIHLASELLRAQADHFAHIITLEMGKRIDEARGEVAFSARILEYYAKHAERNLADVRLHPTHGNAHIESSPMGIIFCIEPWNFPFYQLARVAGPHLMAGNVLMVKHSEIVPQCGEAFEQLLIEAGAPVGLYTNIMISHKQAETLVADPRIKGVALTGSVGAGKAVSTNAGKSLKVSTMELGGSDAFIVFDDADLDETIKWAVWGRMYNTGQTCCAAKRFILVGDIADAFLERFQAALTALTPGDPIDPATLMGPLSTETALLALVAQVDTAVANGAKVVMGGQRIDRPGAFMQPTILTEVTSENPMYRAEFFGPVAMVFRVADEDAAVALANDSDFGLGGSVFTRDEARAKRVASRIETGMMFINCIDWADAELPFGGLKNSGYGRELGAMGIQAFVNKKLVRTNSAPAPV